MFKLYIFKMSLILINLEDRDKDEYKVFDIYIFLVFSIRLSKN